MTDRWNDRQAAEFTALAGRRISGWAGEESAFREKGPDGMPQFEDPNVPCLQLWHLHASLDHDSTVAVGTAQYDDTFGLSLSLDPALRSETDSDDAELRWRSLPELPVGEIEHVRVFVASDTICEVLLRVADQEVLLVAGELDEHFDGRLIFHYLDESVLVFTDPDAASKIPWWAGNREGVTLYAESSSEQRP